MSKQITITVDLTTTVPEDTEDLDGITLDLDPASILVCDIEGRAILGASVSGYCTQQIHT
jgi:hypothetical protein